MKNTKPTMNVWTALCLLVVCLIVSACSNAPIQMTRFIDWQNVDRGVQVLNLSGQSVEVGYTLTFPETIEGLKAWQATEPDTFTYAENTGNFLLGWANGTDWAMVELTPDGFFARHLGDLFRGTHFDAVTITDALKQTPGRMVPTSAIPVAAMQALNGLLKWASAAMDTVTVPAIIILPDNNFNFNNLAQD